MNEKWKIKDAGDRGVCLCREFAGEDYDLVYAYMEKTVNLTRELAADANLGARVRAGRKKLATCLEEIAAMEGSTLNGLLPPQRGAAQAVVDSLTPEERAYVEKTISDLTPAAPEE